MSRESIALINLWVIHLYLGGYHDNLSDSSLVMAQELGPLLLTIVSAGGTSPTAYVVGRGFHSGSLYICHPFKDIA